MLTPIHLLDDQPVSILRNDHLGIQPLAQTAARAILGAEGPFTIGIHGAWGYGKTTLLRLTMDIICPHDNIVTVWFNAWQFEREKHPLFSLITAIINEIDRTLANRRDMGRSVKQALQVLGKSLLVVASGIELTIPTPNPSVKIDLGKMLDRLFNIYKKRNPLEAETAYLAAYKQLEDASNRCGDKVKIVVFIDDLDRCHPDNAVFLLECIKLILSLRGFVFVLAVDRRVIECYLERKYSEYLGEENRDVGRFYLDKIIQLPINIPSHHSRFNSYFDRVINNLEQRYTGQSPHNNESGALLCRLLRSVKAVMMATANDNPRSLVRLVNSFMMGCNLWQCISPLADYADLDEDIAAAVIFNQVLQQILGPDYNYLIYGNQSQQFCDDILNSELDKYYAPA